MQRRDVRGSASGSLAPLTRKLGAAVHARPVEGPLGPLLVLRRKVDAQVVITSVVKMVPVTVGGDARGQVRGRWRGGPAVGDGSGGERLRVWGAGASDVELEREELPLQQLAFVTRETLGLRLVAQVPDAVRQDAHLLCVWTVIDRTSLDFVLFHLP